MSADRDSEPLNEQPAVVPPGVAPWTDRWIKSQNYLSPVAVPFVLPRTAERLPRMVEHGSDAMGTSTAFQLLAVVMGAPFALMLVIAVFQWPLSISSLACPAAFLSVCAFLWYLVRAIAKQHGSSMRVVGYNHLSDCVTLDVLGESARHLAVKRSEAVLELHRVRIHGGRLPDWIGVAATLCVESERVTLVCVRRASTLHQEVRNLPRWVQSLPRRHGKDFDGGGAQRVGSFPREWTRPLPI